MNRPTRNTLWGCVFVLALAGLFSCKARAEQDVKSGNFYLPHCVHFLADTYTGDDWMGDCSGIVAAIVYFGRDLPQEVRFCAPPGSTNGQAVRVIVNYLQARPEILHLDFRALAANALHNAWSCK